MSLTKAVPGKTPVVGILPSEFALVVQLYVVGNCVTLAVNADTIEELEFEAVTLPPLILIEPD